MSLLEVGIHFNLTAGPPVLALGRIPSLVGPDGTFHGFASFFGRVALNRICWSEVALEWDAQFKLGQSLGCHFSFLTSHQHVHMLPSAAEICADIARRHGVPVARLANFRVAEMLRPFRPKGIALAPFVPAVRTIFRQSDLVFNDTTLELSPVDSTDAVAKICEMLKRLP